MNAVVLELKDISKSFGAVNALTGVDLTVHAGEVVALAGDNGAGKSTLVKIITGVHAPSSGSMKINGKLVHFNTPKEAANAGVAAVYQDLSLCDNLSAAANLMLGQEPRRRGWRAWLGMIDTDAMHVKARTALSDLGIRTLASTETLVSFLSGGQRQAIAIVRASLEEANIIVLDEPTAALGVRERDLVYSLIEKLKSSGYGIVLISHSVPEILRLADRVSVLRLGRIATTLVGAEMEGDAIVSAITGSKVEEGEKV